MPFVKINNIIIHGRFTHKSNIVWSSKTVYYIDNSIRLTKNSLNLKLTKNIEKIICEKNIHKDLSRTIGNAFGRKVQDLHLKVINIQYSCSFACCFKELIKDFIPTVFAQISRTYIAEEQNVFIPISSQMLLESPEKFYSFMSVRVVFCDTIICRFQVSKNREKQSHCSLITTKTLSPEVRRVINRIHYW